ncbi:DEAD/DEAH box helicase [Psychromicrobium xiongbiense]|uniref:DEAD/DEAH box helicase n=1 Tax=Psychromicrobium xiongbiense TaxID=3051184 RepID=UPI002555760D|nr:DEAD/DEAH box helicase [Psychromicrobium sp. YIM S02556]
MTLLDHLPGADNAPDDPDALYEGFVDWNQSRGVQLYPAQDEASLELFTGSHVILATPTGSGKSLVAVALHFAALATWHAHPAGEPGSGSTRRRSYYTAPIKALVSEKFFALAEIFGAHNVGLITGDSSINPEAPIICCTAEILANVALREGAQAAIHSVVMDEFHYIADPQRGWAWQVPLLELPQAQFLLMSATLGDTTALSAELERRTGRGTATITHTDRPIPLHYYYVQTPVHESLEELLSTHQAPVYLVHFSQAEAIERAQSLMSVTVASRAERDQIAKHLARFRFSPGFGATLSRLIRHGIGVHHAGMLPKYRRLVEQLAQEGLLKVICGTDTLGVGINVPIRTVLLTALSKYDGVKTRLLHAREFHQLAGRAGRAGFDTAGTVIVQAPEHVVENVRAMAKAQKKFGDDQRKLRQVVRRKPPEGFVSWGEPTFERLVHAEPETLTPTFTVSHSMLLNLMERPGDPVQAARRLLTENRESPSRQASMMRTALGILRELLAAGVVVRIPESERGPDGRGLRLTVDVQADFALNQPLSPFALAALELLDPESPDYALDLLSVIESTLENPRQVLAAQRNYARSEAVAQMKAEGMEYEQRMTALEAIDYPQPLGELLHQAFETYRAGAPWLGDFQVQPKSVLRDLLERAMNFGEFVRFYSLARSEGILLRYLADALRALRQTVPPSARTPEVEDTIEWLGEIVRQTDSSLLDEWEAMMGLDISSLGSGQLDSAALSEAAHHATQNTPQPLTGNERAFRVMVRNEMFRRVTLASRDDFRALGELDADAGWPASRWEDALGEYWDEHDELDAGPQARGPALFDLTVQPGGRRWKARQIIADPAGHHDWSMSAEVDLDASDEAGYAVLRFLDMSRN